MSPREALRVLGSIVLGLLMFFAGKGAARHEQAEADEKAKEKATEIETKVNAAPINESRKELKQWSGKKQ
jgi:hypothetical protein